MDALRVRPRGARRQQPGRRGRRPGGGGAPRPRQRARARRRRRLQHGPRASGRRFVRVAMSPAGRAARAAAGQAAARASWCCARSSTIDRLVTPTSASPSTCRAPCGRAASRRCARSGRRSKAATERCRTRWRASSADAGRLGPRGLLDPDRGRGAVRRGDRRRAHGGDRGLRPHAAGGEAARAAGDPAALSEDFGGGRRSAARSVRLEVDDRLASLRGDRTLRVLLQDDLHRRDALVRAAP